MKQKRHRIDEIIAKLRQAEVELGNQKKVPEAFKAMGITQPAYHRWRQKYGSLQPAMVKAMKALQKEKAQLKKLVADQALDMEILKEAPGKMDTLSHSTASCATNC